MLLRKVLTVFLCISLKIGKLYCDDGGSLGFAIDDTYSMDDDIRYVREGAEAIMKLVLSKKSDIKDIVLVTFNDPDVELRTNGSAQSTFLNDLSAIYPHGGGDCPEMALTGLNTALSVSRPGSYIFVFTDANAKDYHKLNQIHSLCQKKQSQVMIVYSRDKYCYDPKGVMFNVYYDIAKACSGQVFIVKKDEVKSILKTIETLLQGKNAIFKWITIPRTQTFVDVEFTIDEKAEYAIVSTSGTNVDLKVTRDLYYLSPQVNHERVMWNDNGKVVRLIAPSPGTYYAWVKGESTISMVVYGRTDFTFQHGFSVLEPKLLADTSKQPIAGIKQFVSINVTDPDNSVNIQTVRIVDINNVKSETNYERVIDELTLRNIGKGFYITEPFVSPNFTFKITVKGETKVTHQTITRSSKNIDPQIVDLVPKSKPDVKIEEGNTLDVNYGSGVSLTCKVTAHPAPKIQWYSSSGHLLPSKNSVVDDPLFISYLKQENIKQSETFICKASNSLDDSVRESRIQVNVRPIFTVTGEAVYNAKYGEDARIPCNIQSYLPFTTKWFKSNEKLTGNSVDHTISRDGSELTLISMDIKKQGIYTCEATLKSDPTIKKTRNRDVKIPGLVHPNITYATSVLKDKTLTAICRVVGFPKPIISWEFKPKHSKVSRTIFGSGEELIIPGMGLKDSGIYKCKVKNILGETEHKLIVNVEEHPIIYNDDSSYYGVEGDLVMKILCNVTGFPEPTIIWKKEGEPLKLDSKYKTRETTLYINKLVQSDTGKYTCEAKNKLGEASTTYFVNVVDNFEGDETFNGDTHEVYIELNKPQSIKCNLKNEERSVRWYMDGMLTKQTGATYEIEMASIQDEANYTCRVNTENGSVSETYVVHVGYPPTFLRNSRNTIDWHKDGQTLDCAIESEPPAKFEWLYNGKVVENKNSRQQKFVITNWGEYTCKVSNVLGHNQKSFKVTTSGCFITKNFATQNQPLISDISLPTWPNSIGNSHIILQENENIKLSCPDTKSANYFKVIPSKKEVIAKCLKEDTFTVDGNIYSFSELQCSAKVEPTLINTNKQCIGSNSKMLRVGFDVNGFLDVYEVCYDIHTNAPLYASASNQISSETDGVDLTFDWSSMPDSAGRKTGNWKPDGSCYTQRQLVNVNEMPIGPAQAASFIDNLNSVAVWNTSCGDSARTSWQTVDDVTRQISLSEKLFSWTGASGYAPKDGGLVPRYLWKVIKAEEEFFVMVYVNDKSPIDSDVLCTSSCNPIVDAEKFLYCCSLNEFSQQFKIPLNTFMN